MRTFLPILAPALLATLLACGGDDDSCFVRGTRVLTPRGWTPIDQLAEGDEVVSFDVERGVATVRRVVRVMQRTAPRVVRVRAGEIAIAGASPEHPFWDAAAAAFRPVAALSLDSRLLVLLPGAKAPRELAVDEIQVLPTRGPVEVWNLEVEGEHTYFVEGMLVHNKAGGASAASGTGGAGGAGGAVSDGGGAPATGSGGAGGSPAAPGDAQR